MCWSVFCLVCNILFIIMVTMYLFSIFWGGKALTVKHGLQLPSPVGPARRRCFPRSKVISAIVVRSFQVLALLTVTYTCSRFSCFISFCSVISGELHSCPLSLSLVLIRGWPLVEFITLYLHACQVRVTVGDSGLCCCTCVTYFER